jgi:hypothetical protein
MVCLLVANGGDILQICRVAPKYIEYAFEDSGQRVVLQLWGWVGD